MHTRSGFSLVELLAALSIVSIVIVIGITSLASFQKKSQEQILLSQLLRAIQLTRSEAVTRNEPIILCSKGQWQNGFVIKTAERELYTFENFSAHGVLHWRTFPQDRAYLEISPTGMPRAGNGTFWFCRENAVKPSWEVVVNRTGRARVVYPDKDGDVLDSKGVALTC